MAEAGGALESHQPLTHDWRTAAACRYADPDLFFPVSSTGGSVEQATQAKAVCARCRVRRECLQYALATHQTHGVWAA